MILNEDYFKDLEITDDDVIEDDNDVEGPYNNLTLKDVHKLHEQYNHCISIRIVKENNSDTTFFQTILIPKLFKRLDDIFDMYGIEHSEYVLSSTGHKEKVCDTCDTVVKFGNYQLFCLESDKDEFINNIYDYFLINVYVNYPVFNYKRAFRFLYTVINIYRMDVHINSISFYPYAKDYVTGLNFRFHYYASNDIIFMYFDRITRRRGPTIFLCDEEKLTEEYKIAFYDSVLLHFFGEESELVSYKSEKRISYKVLDRDVPIKHRF